MATTSALLCLLAGAFKKKVLLWDDADNCPDPNKVMTMFDWIGEHGFSWDTIQLDPNNPESWEYLADEAGFGHTGPQRSLQRRRPLRVNSYPRR